MPDYKEHTRDTYNRIADAYIERDTRQVNETAEVNASLEHFAALLPAGGLILDIGTGGGRDARFFARLGKSVVAIDTADQLLQKAAAVHPNDAITYKVMDMENLDFPAQTFDGVWANASLHHMPKQNLPAVLAQIATILKPEGYLQVKVHHGEGEGMVPETKFGIAIERFFANYTPEELRQILIATGFLPEYVRLATDGKWVDALARLG